MKALSFIFMSFLFISFSAKASKEEVEKKSKLALNSSTKWLKLLDQGKYSTSWKKASSLFKDQVSASKWQNVISKNRGPLGKVVSRTLLSKNYRTSLPGAPEGEYVVIQFKTKFKNKKEVTETITPVLDKEGKWKVSGYYIR